MRITFPTGNVDIPAGTSVMLGRDPAESLVAAAFARFDNVSRRHATVQVDDAGHATIRDEGSTNGTYVNDDRVLPGTEVRLVDGDRVRLAADVTGNVSLPQAEPDPSGLSRNNMTVLCWPGDPPRPPGHGGNRPPYPVGGLRPPMPGVLMWGEAEGTSPVTYDHRGMVFRVIG